MHNLRAVVLVGVAVILLGAGSAPATASAGADATAGASLVTTKLHPGWNMIGWLGPETPVGHLFETVSAIEGVWVFDTADQRYRGATRGSLEGALTLTPGIGLWLYVSGDKEVPWDRPIAAESVVLMLEEGSNLVAWAGEGSTVSATLARLGKPVVFAARWSAEQQRFDLHVPDGPDSFRTLTALTPGDAIWVEMSGDAYWWVPGTERPRFDFAPGITAEEQEILRHNVDTVLAVFAHRFGVHTTDFTVSARTVPGCFASYRSATVTRNANCFAHEYFHILQFDLARGGDLGPGWMIEGPARYAEAVYDEFLNQAGDDRRGYDQARWFAVRGSVQVPSLENPQRANEPFVTYNLGFLATEWLVNHAGRDALIDYYKRLPSSPTWERAFEGAFGISVEDFYAAFEAYRAGVAPPLPHLVDDAVGPVVAFLGNVPKETRAMIQAELDRVTTFFADQLGTEPAEYTTYVAENSDAARATYKRFFLDLNVEESCSVAGTVVFHVLSCPHALDYRTHLRKQSATILWDTGHENYPFWLASGGRYLEARYRRANGLGTAAGLDFDGELFQHTRVAKQSSVPMQRIETFDGWSATGDSEANALTFLALDWLARRAGEGSLVEFYRLLPRGHPSFSWHEPNAGSWQAAFEQAFGLTIEDFYEAFADYRSGLR